MRVRRPSRPWFSKRKMPFFQGFRRATGAVARGLALASVVTFVAACDKAPSAQGLKEWTAADHEREAVPNASPSEPRADAGRMDAVIEATWQNQCALCHGVSGHGDGPQGPMVHAPDLTREDWQSKIQDAEIASTIANGKGRMPKFDLPAEVTEGLVQRIRSLRGK